MTRGVRAILLDIDSPGGETAGCFDLSDYIYSVRGIKPVYAVANDIALSAAYAIASSASKVFRERARARWVRSACMRCTWTNRGSTRNSARSTPTSSRARRRWTAIRTSRSPNARKGDIQDEVDREYGIFTETVARNRKAGKKEIVATQAAVVWADNALPLLADAGWHVRRCHERAAPVAGRRGRNVQGGGSRNSHERRISNGTDRARGRSPPRKTARSEEKKTEEETG